MIGLRQIICVLIIPWGLRIVDVNCFAQAQKMVWVEHLSDDCYDSMWKSIEFFLFFFLCTVFTLILKFYGNPMLPKKVLFQLKKY